MNRRQVIPLLAAPALLPLSACGPRAQTKRFRVIATAEVDGERVEGSSVMEAEWQPAAKAMYEHLFGEAVILDLKGRGTVFILPGVKEESGSYGFGFYVNVLKQLIDFKGKWTLEPSDFPRIASFAGRHRYDGRIANTVGRFPIFVAFKDERDSSSIFEVDQNNLTATFGPGVRFISFEIEITDAPLTNKIKQRLPWLVSPSTPIGLPRSSLPFNRQSIGERIVYEHFVGFRKNF